MSRKPETTFYTAVNRLLPLELHKEKMNNPYRGGTADFWYSGNAGDQWAEYKWIPYSPRSVFRADLSPLQLKWLRERHTEGRSVVVIVGCPAGAMILHDQMWEQDTLPDFVLTKQNIADWIKRRTYRAPQNADISDSRARNNAHVQASNSQSTAAAPVVDTVSGCKTKTRRHKQ